MARPGSLLVRTNLVLAVSAVAIAITSILALKQFVIDPIAESSASDEAALLVLSAQTWVELPPPARPYFELELAQNHDLIVSADVRELPAAETDLYYLSLLQDKLQDRLGIGVTLMQGDELVWANIPMGGYLLQLGFSPGRRDIQPLYVALVIALMGAVIVFLTSLLIVRRIARPLVETADAVKAFRGGEGFVELPETGPQELVTLARSFNTMAKEVAALLSNRTTLLAGISHDLRTPLARMRLILELLPHNVDPDLIQRLERNLEAMDALIGDALRFARGAAETPLKIHLKIFLEDLLATIDAGAVLEFDAPDDLQVAVAPGALQRVLQNLLVNAKQHGSGPTLVRVVSNKHVDIHIVDQGAGIPEEYREKVFQPFFRLDKSRSLTTGGSGLGLAIVAQLCQSHGWKIWIHDAPGGGADVQIRLSRKVIDSPIERETKSDTNCHKKKAARN